MTKDESSARPFRWLAEILEDPDALKPPTAVVPRLVWENHVTLLAAPPKGGKSTMAAAAAAAVSSGNSFFGGRCTKGRVLYISLEESVFLTIDKLVAFGGDPNAIGIVGKGPYVEGIVEDIVAAAEEIQPSLIIWDTLGAFADIIHPHIDPGNSAQWTRVMAIVTEISRRYGATLLLHHARKSDGKYRDSSAIGANVDMIVEMFGERDDPRVLKGIGRFEFDDFKTTFTEGSYHLVRTFDALMDDVKLFVGLNPRCSARDILTHVEGRAADVTKAKDVLLKRGEILNVGSVGAHAYMLKGNGS